MCNRFADVATRGGSLASSRGYLDIVSHDVNVQAANNQPNPVPNHAVALLCSKYADQSLRSFCSNVSFFWFYVNLVFFLFLGNELFVYDLLSQLTEHSVRERPPTEQRDRVQDQHRWSDSECCTLAFELQNLQPQALHWAFVLRNYPTNKNIRNWQ